MRAKLTWLFAVVVALGGLATVVGAGGKPKPSGAVPKPLSVVIHAWDGSEPCAICPDPKDNGAPYVDGQGVSAQIDQYGSLIIDFGTRNVLFKSGVLHQAAGLPDDELLVRADTYLATRGPIRLQELGENGNPNHVCHQMNWVIKDGALNTEYRLLFQRSGYPDEIGDAVAETAWALVTKTSQGKWTVEPRACGGMSVDDDAVIVSLPMKGKGDYTYWGTEALPFKLTLTAK